MRTIQENSANPVASILLGDNRLDHILSIENYLKLPKSTSNNRIPGFIAKPNPLGLLIKGPAGSGKTTLLAQILCSTLNAYPGALALLLCQEERTEQMTAVLESFGWTSQIIRSFKMSEVRLSSPKLSPSSVHVPLRTTGGLLMAYFDLNYWETSRMRIPWFSRKPGAILNSFFEDVSQYFGLGAHGPHIFAVDSLNALVHTHRDGLAHDRYLLDDFMKVPLYRDCHAIFTNEETPSHCTEEYLSDVVIQLGTDIEGHRSFRVSKARMHNLQPLLHLMEIQAPSVETSSSSPTSPLGAGLAPNPDPGVTVYPNLELFDYTLSRIKEITPREENSYFDFGLDGIEQQLHHNQDNRHGIPSFSSTLLWGGPLTKKTEVALQFARRNHDQSHSCCFIHFEDLGSTLFDSELSKYTQAGFAIVPLTSLPRDVSQLLERLRQIVANSDWTRKFTIVILRDLHTLIERYSFPEVRRLFPVLMKMFRTFYITPVFLHSTTIPSQFADIIDNVISFHQIGETSHMHTATTAVAVGKYSGVVRPVTPLELVIRKTERRLEAIPGTLEDMVALGNGVFTVGELTLWLYEESSNMRRFYRKLLYSLAPQVDTERRTKIHIKYFSPEIGPRVLDVVENECLSGHSAPLSCEEVFAGLLAHTPLPQHASTDAIMVDEYVVQKLVQQNRLMDLSLVDHSVLAFVKGNFHEHTAKTSMQETAVFGVPFYENVSVLAFDKIALLQCKDAINIALSKKYGVDTFDFVDDIFLSEKVPRYALTWEALDDIGNIVRQRNEYKELPTLSMYYVGQECFASFLLEFLGRDILEEAGTAYNLKPPSQQTLSDRLLDLLVTKLFWNKPPLSTKLLQKGHRALFVRTWYSLVFDMTDLLRRHESGQGPHSDYGITLMPARSTDCAPVSFKGQFYLSLLTGSLNPRRGLSVIRDMTSVQSNLLMERYNVAIPASKAVSEAGGENMLARRARNLYGVAKSRGQISGYESVRESLYEVMYRVLCLNENDMSYCARYLEHAICFGHPTTASCTQSSPDANLDQKSLLENDLPNPEEIRPPLIA